MCAANNIRVLVGQISAWSICMYHSAIQSTARYEYSLGTSGVYLKDLLDGENHECD